MSDEQTHVPVSEDEVRIEVEPVRRRIIVDFCNSLGSTISTLC
jgi:hypothetical protein